MSLCSITSVTESPAGEYSRENLCIIFISTQIIASCENACFLSARRNIETKNRRFGSHIYSLGSDGKLLATG